MGTESIVDAEAHVRRESLPRTPSSQENIFVPSSPWKNVHFACILSISGRQGVVT